MLRCVQKRKLWDRRCDSFTSRAPCVHVHLCLFAAAQQRSCDVSGRAHRTLRRPPHPVVSSQHSARVLAHPVWCHRWCAVSYIFFRDPYIVLFPHVIFVRCGSQTNGKHDCRCLYHCRTAAHCNRSITPGGGFGMRALQIVHAAKHVWLGRRSLAHATAKQRAHVP
jgi:hypothetical protein